MVLRRYIKMVNVYALGSPSILKMEFHPSSFKLILMDVRLPMTTLVGVMAICIVAYYRSPWRRLPPGPPGLPFIGNLLALKERRIWSTFTKWSKLYGGWDCRSGH